MLAHGKLEDFNKAENYAIAMLNIGKKLKNNYDINYGLGFVAYTKIFNNKLEEALFYIKKIEEVTTEKYRKEYDIEYTYLLVRYFYHFKNKELDLAYSFIKKLEKYIKEEDPYSMNRILKYLSEIEVERNNLNLALNYKKNEILHLEKTLENKSLTFATFYEKKQEKEMKERRKKKLLKKKKTQEISERNYEDINLNMEKFFQINLILFSLIIISLSISFMLYTKFKNISNLDYLTKLYNRRYIREKYNKLNQKKKNLSFILFDLDYFKKINDTYGHDIGDKVLLEISKIMKKETRKKDILSRIGGEEFLILTKNNKEVAIQMAERLRKSIEKHDFSKIDKKLKITASFGVSNSVDSECINDMYTNADKGLYYSKNNGRNRVYYFNKTVD